MSKKALIAHLGLQHRSEHELIDIIELALTSQRKKESALQLAYDKWVLDNCDSNMRRAIDEIELGWRLMDYGVPTQKQFPYREIGSRSTNDQQEDPYGFALDVLKVVREFEVECLREYPVAWRCFVERFKRGESLRGIDKMVRLRNGIAGKNVLLILKMYCKKRRYAH